VAGLVLLAVLMLASDPAVAASASRFVPGVKWKAESTVSADFTCQGHMQHAVLGIDQEQIVIAVFLNGANRRPVVLRDLGRATASAFLETEDLDWDPNEDGMNLPGFQRSKKCKGLNLGDDEVDSLHLYWNHKAHQFVGWSRQVGFEGHSLPVSKRLSSSGIIASLFHGPQHVSTG